jgi:hypothetical protein
MKIFRVIIYWLMMAPVQVWVLVLDDKKFKENIDWVEWFSERTCYKMRTNRLIRWLKCHHHWNTYDANDSAWILSRAVIYGKLRYDAKKIKVCDKCGEVRTVGKGVSEKW